MKALIHNDRIIEIKENTYPVHESLIWIDLPEGAEVGDSYVSGELVKPQAETTTWEDIRSKRDSLLQLTDWHITYSIEKNTTVPQNILDYRQSLRDLPQTYQNPEDVVFPTI